MNAKGLLNTTGLLRPFQGLAMTLLLPVFLLQATFCYAKQTVELVDSDKDGVKETQKIYVDGKLKKIARDANGDGKPDGFKEFLKGRDLILVEKDRNFDGKIDQRKVMQWGSRRLVPGQPLIPSYVTISKDEDNDFDGRFETHWEKGQKKK